MKSLEGKIVLITGASRGIGACLAPLFAREGAHVILLARTVGGLEAVDDEIKKMGGTSTLVPMDLREHALIDTLGATLYERWGRLDILVGNAAMLGGLTPVAHTEPKIWQQVMDVNVTANYRLIRSMDSLLRQSDAGRAIFVTSGLAQVSVPYFGAYAASKAALESMVRTYAEEVAHTNMRVNLFDPGIVKTSMRAQAFPGEDKSHLADPVAVAQSLLQLATAECGQLKDIYYAA